MRYSKEFKLDCVKKYLSGEEIKDPKGCKHETFHHKVNMWVRLYESLGEDALSHTQRLKTPMEKMKIVERYLSGEDSVSISVSLGIEPSLILKWVKIYGSLGYDGLKSLKRGRPKMKDDSNKKKTDQIKTDKDLLKENEYLRAENEYLKKLNALVQKRRDQQPKKK